MALRIERPGAGSKTMERWEELNGNRGDCAACGHPAGQHWMITDTLDPSAGRADCRQCGRTCAGKPRS